MMPKEVVFIPNKAGLDYIAKQNGGDFGRFLASRAAAIVIAAKVQAPVKTGMLKASIRVHSHTRTSYGQAVKVGSDLSYALYVHEGTRPHVIIAKPGKMLRFTSKGRVVYSREVVHPGIKPNRYLSDNLELISAGLV